MYLGIPHSTNHTIPTFDREREGGNNREERKAKQLAFGELFDPESIRDATSARSNFGLGFNIWAIQE
jgi:hypothetical protein